MKDRHIGQVSFNLMDGYEKELFKYAYKEEHGEFSKYVKRLIERDREGRIAHALPKIQKEFIEEDVCAANTFL